ncbi:uncharacterized protein LOC117649755 isoform X2 [Thrips palmi]|uniref:Uncharacterized protein LOC117649755 isoform X2 n=1 Tax=Thrips palmi TaxID=161013 RepID=A0A6P8ZUN6_THRPL|nr:uncharacterized protein LOC117649755 isoform X2 [Thrips palmi]
MPIEIVCKFQYVHGVNGTWFFQEANGAVIIMENLPTEVLLNIFGRLKDATTLLDCVSLVCWRWNALAKDPRAWASVSCTCYVMQKTSTIFKSTARILKHAPALSKLTFRTRELVSAEEAADLIADGLTLGEVLNLCRCSISTVDVCCTLTMAATQAVCAWMERNSHTLRSLSMFVNGKLNQRRRQLNSIKSLVHLQELVLVVRESPRYQRELHESLTSLRVLKYSVSTPLRKVPENHVRLLADLLRGAAATLCHVDIDVILGPSAVQALKQCTRLTSATLNMGAVGAVHAMASLRELTLAVRSPDDRCPRNAEMPAVGTLCGLRLLRLNVETIVKADVGCGPMLQALGLAAPNVATLVVNYGRSASALVPAMEKDVCEFLETHPGLTAVTISSGGASLVPRLAGLTDLQDLRVDLRIPLNDWGTSCETFRSMSGPIRGVVKLIPVEVEPKTFRWMQR